MLLMLLTLLTMMARREATVPMTYQQAPAPPTPLPFATPRRRRREAWPPRCP
jgi:hypothetical protein